MGTDCLTKAMGYDHALGKQAAGLVRQVFCNPRCESCVITGRVLSPHPDSERLNPPRRHGAHRSGC